MDAKTLCLGALMIGDASGYEIRKLFEDGPFSQYHPISFGSIYPALTALAKEGLIDCTTTAQDGKPDKKVYAINEAGRAYFVGQLMAPLGHDKFRSEFLFALTFGQLLPPGKVSALLDEYLATFDAHLACMAEKNPADFPPGRRFIFGLGQASYRAVAEYIRENRHLLEQDASRGDAA